MVFHYDPADDMDEAMFKKYEEGLEQAQGQGGENNDDEDDIEEDDDDDDGGDDMEE